MSDTTRAFLTASFDQLWAAATDGDAAGVAAVADALASHGHLDAAAELRNVLMLLGQSKWTTSGLPEPVIFRDAADGVCVTLSGDVTSRLFLRSHQGERYAILVLTCDDGVIRVQVPPATYLSGGWLIAQGEPLCVYGRVDRRGDRPELIAHRIEQVPTDVTRKLQD